MLDPCLDKDDTCDRLLTAAYFLKNDVCGGYRLLLILWLAFSGMTCDGLLALSYSAACFRKVGTCDRLLATAYSAACFNRQLIIAIEPSIMPIPMKEVR